jgi:hypothetical protein
VKLAGKITDGKKTVLEKAKAIYDWTCVNTYRDPKTRGCGEGNICNLLANPGASVPIFIRYSLPCAGRDLVLNPRQPGEPVNYLMYPFARVGVKTLDWLDPATFTYTITYSVQ